MVAVLCGVLALSSPLAASAAVEQEEGTPQADPATADDPEMQARIGAAWDDVRAYWERRKAGEAEEAEDPQHAYAEEFFACYLEHPDSPTGKRAVSTAFMMWGNLGAADEVDAAIPHVPVGSEVWAEILNGIGNAYARTDRRDDYQKLLLRLADELTHPKSRSEVLLDLGRRYRTEDPERARAYYGDVVALGNPRSFLIDRDGNIAAKDLRGDALEEAARELVAAATTG